jgi:hypothetical protein
MTTSERHELLERRLDLELDELAGRNGPPDRVDAILQRLASAPAARRPWFAAKVAAAALLLLGLAITIVVLASRPTAPTSPPIAKTPAPTPTRDHTAPHPRGTDPADLAAMRSAETMLAAEAQLARLLADGKLPVDERPLPFATLSNWQYRSGLDGMPEAIQALDGNRVTLTGFMLPIDAVRDIQEFLLVPSLWSCCYGQPPDLNGIVRCVLPADLRLDYQFEPQLVTGTLRIQATIENGYCVDIYQLHVTSIRTLRP